MDTYLLISSIRWLGGDAPVAPRTCTKGHALKRMVTTRGLLCDVTLTNVDVTLMTCRFLPIRMDQRGTATAVLMRRTKPLSRITVREKRE